MTSEQIVWGCTNKATATFQQRSDLNKPVHRLHSFYILLPSSLFTATTPTTTTAFDDSDLHCFLEQR